MIDDNDSDGRYDCDDSDEPGTALVERQPDAPRTAVTPAQARVEAVANLTMSAYSKASTLALTPEEIEKLQADFPDDAFRAGANGNQNLIYIEHAHLRDRMNQVFGPGQWSIVPRSRWAEDCGNGCRIYVEAMLLIRGCFVAEAIGDMVYYPANGQTNYGDAVEGAKSSALRRCAKELGIGLQAWKKAWADGWLSRNNNGQKPQPARQPATPPAKKQPAAAPASDPQSRIMAVQSLVKLDDWIKWVQTDVAKRQQFVAAITERAGQLILSAAAHAPNPDAANDAEEQLYAPKWNLIGSPHERDIRAALKTKRDTFPKVKS